VTGVIVILLRGRFHNKRSVKRKKPGKGDGKIRYSGRWGVEGKNVLQGPSFCSVGLRYAREYDQASRKSPAVKRRPLHIVTVRRLFRWGGFVRWGEFIGYIRVPIRGGGISNLNKCKEA